MNQLLVVLTPSWSSVQGTLTLFENAKPVAPAIPVVIGKAGMAWGIGLHQTVSGPQKQEGDLKTPAGIFELGTAFGKEAPPCRMDYLNITPTTEAVDDPKSEYYNQIVKREEAKNVDWTSSEKMNEIDLYEFGFVVQHNFPNPIPGAGSAIFFHLWENSQSGTAGCTAMSLENFIRLWHWLDKAKQPRVVQLPQEEYRELQESWELPEILTSKNKQGAPLL